MTTVHLDVFVKAIVNEALGINSWELRSADNQELPAFTAGAHVDLLLSNELVRSYSLCNAQRERNRYLVTVFKDPASRGGSKLIHDAIRAGDRLRITAPRNNFPLLEDAGHSVFIAGGIGITPIYSMLQRLEELGRSWELHYTTRSPDVCAFLRELRELDLQKPGRVNFYFSRKSGPKMTDIASVIGRCPRDAHCYCCGPISIIRSFEVAVLAAARSREQIHIEYFASAEPMATEGGFTVTLRRSGKSFVIPPGKTILNELRDNNVQVPFSCSQGTCGTCELKVVDGIPDHRDAILTPAEKASNKTIMICCSGSKTPNLVLDL
jgi:vanillate O-demethylase ferredoxin subunit